MIKSRDYSFKKIDFLELKKINNLVFIESAKLKKVASNDKYKTSNSLANYDIDLQNIQYVKTVNDDETFSFRIFQVPTATFQQNIVLECKKNEKPQAYLITYYLTKSINQISGSTDFIRAIKSSTINKIDNPLKTNRTTTGGGCLQIGYYDEVEKCQGELNPGPHCYESDGITRAKIKVFKVIDSGCSTSGGPTDFIPLASQWQNYQNTNNNPYTENSNNGENTGIGGSEENPSQNIFIPNYFEGADLSDPAVQNWIKVNQFLTTLYNFSDEIKGVVDNTEWLLAYTNYWINSNGGLTPDNEKILTFAYNAIPTLFNQYNGTNYELNAINNFKFSTFQFLLFHGEFLSKLDPLTQKSILDEITSLEKIELINNVVNFMIENPSATWEQIENWFMGTPEGQDGEYDAAFWENPNLTFPPQNLPTYNDYLNGMPRFANGSFMTGADNVYGLVGGAVQQARVIDPIRTENTCALKVSIALNRAGVVIPNLPGITLEGSGEFAGKFFFLNAKALNAWMRETFGTNTGIGNTPVNDKHLSYNAADGGPNGEDFPNKLKNIYGIYSMITTEEYDKKGASGHADLLFTDSKGFGNCPFYCFFNLPIQRIDIWILE